MRRESRNRSRSLSRVHEAITAMRADIKTMQERLDAMTAQRDQVSEPAATATLPPLSAPAPTAPVLTPDIIAAIVATAKAMR
jgi:endonuclease/exonuclease/phosphatase family metal-dependent hydrolase